MTCGPLAVAGGVWKTGFGAGNYQGPNPLPMLLNWTDPDIDGLFFQEEGYNYTLPNGTTVFIQCNDGGGFVTNITEGVCQPPLVQQGENCFYECDLLALSKRLADNMKIVFAVFGCAGVIVCGCVFIASILNPRLRILPKGLNISAVLWAGIVALALAYPAITGWRYKEIWCEGNKFISTKYEQFFTSNGQLQYRYVNLEQFTAGGLECSFEGFMLYIGLLRMIFDVVHIVLYQSFFIFAALIPCLGKIASSTPGYAGQITINLIINIILTVLVVGVGSGLWGGGYFKMSVGSPYCFLDPSDVAVTVITWIIPVFVAVVVLVVDTCFLFGFLLVQGWKLGIRDMRGNRLMMASLAVAFKGFIVSIIYIGITFYAVYFENNYTTISNDFNNYEQCLINPQSPICATNPSEGSYATPIMFSGAITAIAPLCIAGITFIYPRFWIDMWKFLKSIERFLRKDQRKGRRQFWSGFANVFIFHESGRSTILGSSTLDMTVSPPDDDQNNDQRDEETDEDSSYVSEKTTSSDTQREEDQGKSGLSELETQGFGDIPLEQNIRGV
jgi:hypothetical protein